MQAKTHLWLVKWYGRVVQWIYPGESQGTLLWAAVVGWIGGISTILFRYAIQGILWSWSGHSGSLEEIASGLTWWQRFMVPAVGGLLAGLALYFGARFERGHRSSDYMEAVAVRRGLLSLRQSVTKLLSSLLTICSGGSIGREGAMVQLSAMLASLLGRRRHLSTPRLRLVVACGAAAGIAAVYNVTIASSLFVAEILLGSIAMESLGPLLVAAMVSSLVSRSWGGAEAYFSSPVFELASPWEIIPYLFMGVLLGLAAPGYVRILRWSEDCLTALVPQVYWRMTLGGLIVGALAIPFPEVWGNGRTMVNLVLSNPWPWGILAAILVCKVTATAATTGSGAVGGVFTPTMFTGAMLGCLFGHGVGALWPGQTAGPQAYALVGMSGFLAAVTRAPLMSILMLFEMTLDYGVVLPLMLVCVVAYHTARSVNSDSIYSESLRRKQRGAAPAKLSEVRVRDLMRPPPATVMENAPFSEIARLFASQPYGHLPVVDLHNQLRGLIALREIENQLQSHKATDWATAASLMRRDLETVTPEATLSEALDAFHHYHGERLPVVKDKEKRELVGYISKTDVLLTLAHGLKTSPRDLLEKT